jgi:hypothetical protein
MFLIIQLTVSVFSVILQGTYVKFHIKFIFQQVMNVPAPSEPPSSFFIRLQPKPVIICTFVILYVLWKQNEIT